MMPVGKEAVPVDVRFVGGPQDGLELRLVNPPPATIRLAVPEWATYRLEPPAAGPLSPRHRHRYVLLALS